MEFAMSAI